MANMFIVTFEDIDPRFSSSNLGFCKDIGNLPVSLIKNYKYDSCILERIKQIIPDEQYKNFIMNNTNDIKLFENIAKHITKEELEEVANCNIMFVRFLSNESFIDYATTKLAMLD
jgi:hypothetical protein